MILWLNGTFGVGKTTTANALCERLSGWRIFDPEWVGYMLRANLRDLDIDDFQDLAPWRSLVPRTMHEVAMLTGDSLVSVQTVLVEEYWRELSAHAGDLGLEFFHVVLDCADDELRSRIERDTVEHEARDWRLDHVRVAAAARPWLSGAADLVVDTTDLTIDEVTAVIADAMD